jgi:hypothetical protein
MRPPRDRKKQWLGHLPFIKMSREQTTKASSKMCGILESVLISLLSTSFQKAVQEHGGGGRGGAMS